MRAIPVGQLSLIVPDNCLAPEFSLYLGAQSMFDVSDLGELLGSSPDEPQKQNLNYDAATRIVRTIRAAGGETPGS
jgi:hypothetical protein